MNSDVSVSVCCIDAIFDFDLTVHRETQRVGVADIVEASTLVVQIAPAGVQVPGVAATTMDIGRPPHRRLLNDPKQDLVSKTSS